MRKKHKIFSWIIFLVVFFFTAFFNVKMSDSVSGNLVTFFSVAFGFYITAIAILYNSSYSKMLYEQIEIDNQCRGIHVLKSYFLISGNFTILSIVLIIVFSVLSSKNADGTIETKIDLFVLSINKIVYSFDFNIIFSSLVFSCASLNVFFMTILLYMIIDGMVEEAKNKH